MRGQFDVGRSIQSRSRGTCSKGLRNSFIALIVGAVAFISVNVQADSEANGPSLYPPISFDGRYVAFNSMASNLVPNDTNGTGDIFVYDRILESLSRVSVSSRGEQGNGNSTFAALSGDGRYVVFTSSASNLVDGDINNSDDVFVHDRVTRTTTRVSLGTSGQEANGHSYNYNLPITTDGRYVAFQSLASNLVPNDTNNTWDVFVRDRLTETTRRVSVSSAGAEGHEPSLHSSISASDGRYIAFHSLAGNLVADDANGTWDVFVHDLASQTTLRISLSSSGHEGNGASTRGSISGDGRYVAFDSAATNMVPNDTNTIEDVFVRDNQAGTTIRVSVNSKGQQMVGGSPQQDPKAVITPDGQNVAFRTDAVNLVPNDTNGVQDIFVHDLNTGITRRVSINSSGEQANGLSEHHAISADGRYASFSSEASNLVPNDMNGVSDIFLHDFQTGITTRISVPAEAHSVPTLSELGLIVFTLLLLTIGVCSLRRMQKLERQAV